MAAGFRTDRLISLKQDDASTFVTGRQIVSGVVELNGRDDVGLFEVKLA